MGTTWGPHGDPRSDATVPTSTLLLFTHFVFSHPTYNWNVKLVSFFLKFARRNEMVEISPNVTEFIAPKNWFQV